MPLAHYGVVIGSFASFSRDPTHDYGQWYHGHLRLTTPTGVYEAALDVDAPASVGVSYRLVTDLGTTDIAAVRGRIDGFHPLDPTATSGALDYVRSPLLRNGIWWAAKLATGTAYRLAKRPTPGDPVYGPDLADAVAAGWSRLGRLLPDRVRRHRSLRFFPWRRSDGDNALDALEPHLVDAARIYVFGQQFTSGLGVHDVHQNQGDPFGSQWYEDNGVWQDGAVMAEQPGGQVVVWQVKFNTQSLDTDAQGHPN
jgi:hypothetical protein